MDHIIFSFLLFSYYTLRWNVFFDVLIKSLIEVWFRFFFFTNEIKLLFRVDHSMPIFCVNVPLLKLNCHLLCPTKKRIQQLHKVNFLLHFIGRLGSCSFLGDSILIVRQLFNKYRPSLNEIYLSKNHSEKNFRFNSHFNE